MQDTPRGYLDQRARCIRWFWNSWRRVLQKVPPTRQQGVIAVSFEKPLQQALFVKLLTAEQVEERSQIVVREAFGHGPKAKQKHIQITLGASGPRQPLKLGSEVSYRVLRENVFD